MALPQLHTRVQIRRAEFEALITPALADTVAALGRALRSAQVRPEQLRCIVLAGGSARIPLVSSLVATAFERPVVADEQPELGIALGAARLSMPEGASQPGSGARLAPAAAVSTDTAARVAGSAQVRPAATGADRRPSTPVATILPSPPVMGILPSPPVMGILPPAPVSGIAPRPTGMGMPPVPGAGGPETRPPGAAELAVGQVAVPESRRADGLGWAEGPAQAAGTGKADGAGRLRAYRWPAVAGIAVVLVAVTVTVATAWSRGSSNGGGGSPGGSSAPVAKSAASLVWRVPTGQPATEPPAVTPDHVLLGGSDGTVRAFRRADGGVEWEQSVGPGVRVSTQITAGTAFATTTGGDVVALDVATGAQSWRRSTGTAFDARPIGGPRRVYAGGRDTVLYAYELGAGHRRWRVWTDARIEQPPVLVGDVAVVAAGDRLYGVSQDGALLWKPSVGRATGGPVAAGDAACVPVQGGTVRCVRVADGQVLPRMTLPGAALTGGRGVVFAALADGSVGAWDPHTGGLSWQYRPAGGPPEAGYPVLRAGEVDVAYPDGHLVGLDAATGAELWRYQVDDRFAVAPGGDGAGLVAVGETGILYALRPPGSVAISAHPAPAVTPSPPSVTGQPTAAAPAHRRRTTYSSRSSATDSSPAGKSSSPYTGYPTTPASPSVKPSY